MFNKQLWWKLFRSIPAQFKNSTIEHAVTTALKYYNIPYQIDSYGNIYNLTYKDKPLLNAHMDSVQKVMQFPSDMAFYRTEKGLMFQGDYCMGADDKAGLYIALNILADTPEINFLFTQDEEIGLLGVKHFIRNSSALLNDVTYGIVLDRKGSADIVCKQNDYGTQEFEDALVEVSADGGHGFKPERGVYSDADQLSLNISCANLSVGYYNAHMETEYVMLKEVLNTEAFVRDILRSLEGRKFEKPTPKTYTNSYATSKYGKKWKGHKNGYQKETAQSPWVYDFITKSWKPSTDKQLALPETEVYAEY